MSKARPIKDIVKKIEEQEKKFSEYRAGLHAEVLKSALQSDEENARLKLNEVKLKEEIAQLKENSAKQKDEIAQLKKQIAAQPKESDVKLQKEITKLKERDFTQKEQIVSLDDRNRKLEERNKKLAREIKELKSRLEFKDQQVSKCKKKVEDLTKEKKELIEKLQQDSSSKGNSDLKRKLILMEHREQDKDKSTSSDTTSPKGTPVSSPDMSSLYYPFQQMPKKQPENDLVSPVKRLKFGDSSDRPKLTGVRKKKASPKSSDSDWNFPQNNEKNELAVPKDLAAPEKPNDDIYGFKSMPKLQLKLRGAAAARLAEEEKRIDDEYKREKREEVKKLEEPVIKPDEPVIKQEPETQDIFSPELFSDINSDVIIVEQQEKNIFTVQESPESSEFVMTPLPSKQSIFMRYPTDESMHVIDENSPIPQEMLDEAEAEELEKLFMNGVVQTRDEYDGECDDCKDHYDKRAEEVDIVVANMEIAECPLDPPCKGFCNRVTAIRDKPNYVPQVQILRANKRCPPSRDEKNDDSLPPGDNYWRLMVSPVMNQHLKPSPEYLKQLMLHKKLAQQPRDNQV